ncbi:MAG: DUF4383 domain-containing protein [Anaerolineales bacterium]|nr:DUF4383 domain-containing protein [Anaerolineales bacterium]
MTLTRYFSLIVGILFVLAGIGGFLPVITQPPPADAMPLHNMSTSHGYLLGLFPINILHNIFHFTVGVLGLLAYKQYSTSRLFAQGLAVTLGILTVMGLFPMYNTMFGWFPLYGHDIWLHGLEAVIGAYLGFFAGSQQQLVN